ncbi:MAG: hypothetical protein HY550_06110 [Elusimicrobia bacterium]|nr:hypothetical protein [Elusimicrobiota bacterium]
MLSNFKKIKLPLLILLICVLALLGYRRDSAHTWEVLTGGLPQEISTAKAAINSVYYILKQTHEPLFRKNDGQNYSSRLLSTWSRNIDYSSYIFCLKPGLDFENEKPFDAASFSEHLRAITQNYDAASSISMEGDCARVKFGRGRRGFLDYLTLYENAPTIRKKGGAELGLGPFAVEGGDREQLVMKRKAPVSRGVDKIIFHEYQGDGDKNLENRNISDFNRLSSFEIPGWVKENYLQFANIELNSVDLILNHKDKAVRDVLYNCIDVDRFRRAFVPRRDKFLDIKTVLPVGVPGASPGKPEQLCKAAAEKLKTGKRIVFANWREDNKKELEAFFGDFFQKTGIRVDVVNYSPSDLMRVMFNSPRPYNLLVVVFDAVRPEENVFLNSFFRKENYLDFSLPGISPLYNKMMFEDDPVVRMRYAKEISLELGKERVVLPLYQSLGVLYYPQNIRNLDVGIGFIEYPEVADLRW